MPKLSQLADALMGITSSPEPAAIDPPPAPEPEPEEIAPTPVLDELTRWAREQCKKTMPHLIYADEMTPKQYRQKVRAIRRAMQPPLQRFWDRVRGR